MTYITMALMVGKLLSKLQKTNIQRAKSCASVMKIMIVYVKEKLCVNIVVENVSAGK
jgi:hypothetical protein